MRQMAAKVDHLEAYDVFHAELSSFAHADAHLPNCSTVQRWQAYLLSATNEY